MNWTQALGMIAAGHDVEHVLDIKSAADRESFRAFMLKEAETNPKAGLALAAYDQAMKDLDSGVSGARGTWAALSEAQRGVLFMIVHWEGTPPGLTDKIYRQPGRSCYGMQPNGCTPLTPIGVRTIRALCARDLMAWDGTYNDPELAAVITEKGRFTLLKGRDDV